MYELIMSKAGEKGVKERNPTVEKTRENVISDIKDENAKQLNPAMDISSGFRQSDREDVVKQVIDALKIEEMEASGETKIKITEGGINNTAAMSPTYPAGKYTVQVGSFKTERKAREIVENLASRGYPAFVKTAKNSRKEIWHAIRVGTFKTREEAELYGDELEKRELLIEEAIVVQNDR